VRSNGKDEARGLQPLAPVLVRTLHEAGLAHVMVEGQLARHWKDIVGAQIAAVSHPERVHSQVLFVAVSDTVWLQQLTFYQAQVMQNIRRVLGDVPIAKVRFVLASAPYTSAQRLAEGAQGRALTTVEERQIESATADIGDADLRERIRCAWRRAWTLRRSVP
jgi:predicted nucleic acid-binding Zn ribbon protein